MRKLIGEKGFFRFYVLDSHFRGNDAEKWVGGIGGVGGLKPTLRPPYSPFYSPIRLTESSEIPKPSFPRRRESKVVGAETYWIKRFL